MAKSNKFEKTKKLTDSRILGSRMSLKCVVFIIQRQKITANGLNKPKQKVWYVNWVVLETAFERGLVLEIWAKSLKNILTL